MPREAGPETSTDGGMSYDALMNAAGQPVVYFSYRVKASKEHAVRLAQWLRERSSFKLFADDAIPPGSHWPSALQDGLDRASAILIFIDPNWLRYQDDWGRRRIDNPEDWVHREVHHALSRSKAVLPVLVGGAHMPPKQALPKPLGALAEVQAAALRLDRHFEDDAAVVLSWLESVLSADETSPSDSRPRTRAESALQTRIDRLEVSGFRCLEHMTIDFSGTSTLPGNWTCVAGVNGAGKSSILQAISLLLMGPDFARELGGGRLQAMRRQMPEGSREKSTVRGWLHRSGEDHYVEIVLGGKGPTASETAFWSTFDSLPAVGYGASRNLSDTTDTRWQGVSEIVLVHVSLFDPMASLAGAGVLLRGQSWPAQKLFKELIERVFSAEEVRVEDDGRFSVARVSVDALDLPDGFRSSAAWMADLCVRFHAARPSTTSLDEVSGIVLLDEIDLHLHASLQRAIVPRLREALPNVQFIVTSHSPLIISSFDRNELVLLDRSRTGGIRPLDRQVFGFSSNEIYNWLMETEPRSAALDKTLLDGTDPDLAVLLYQSPEYSEKEARERHERQKDLLREMGYQEGDEV